MEGRPVKLAPLALKRLALAAELVQGLTNRAGRRAIHDARVALRRAQPFVKLARPDVPKSERRAWIKEARRAERLLSPVRNSDVASGLAREGLRVEPKAAKLLLRRLARRRVRRLEEALDEFGEAPRALWAAAGAALAERIGLSDAAAYASRLAKERRRRRERAAEAARGLELDSKPDDWHALRKELRLLRYAIDDGAELGRPAAASEKKLLELQPVLGDANDWAVLERRIAKELEKQSRGSPSAKALKKLWDWAEGRRRRLLRKALPAVRELF